MAHDDPRRAGQDADRAADKQQDRDNAADPRQAGRDDAADQGGRRPQDQADREAADRT